KSAHPVLPLHGFIRIRIDHQLAETVAGFTIEPVKRDPLTSRCNRVKCNGAANQRKLEKAYPITPGSHSETPWVRPSASPKRRGVTFRVCSIMQAERAMFEVKPQC